MRTFDETDGAIERYLDGTMDAAERASFLVLVERNPEAARALEMERAIRSALFADRAALPIDRTAGRAELLASLAVLPPAPSGAPASGGAFGATSSLATTAIGSIAIMAVAVLTVVITTPDDGTTSSASDAARHSAATESRSASNDATSRGAVDTPIPQHAASAADARAFREDESVPTENHRPDVGLPARKSPAIADVPAYTPAPYSIESSAKAPVTTSSDPAPAIGDAPRAAVVADASPVQRERAVDQPAAELPVILRDSIDLDVRLDVGAP